METALELFASQGYHQTSISMIARKAGMSKGLMYNYFNSKEDLIRQIIQKGMDEIFRYFDPDHDGVLTKEEIRYFIDEMFGIMQRDSHFWKLYFMVMLQPPVFKLMEDELRKPYDLILDLLEAHFSKTGTADPEAEARILGAILDGIAFQFILDPGHFPTEKIKNKLYEMYCQ